MRSAQRAGCVVVSCMMPWHRRICLVRWLAAARNTSGAGECEYSSRKWCSTSQAIVVAEPVGQLDLVERVLVEPQFAALLPWARQLQLVEDAEFHRTPLLWALG